LCPGASPEFILQQAEITENSAIKVVQAFAAVQAKQIADLQAAQTQQAAQQTAEEQQRVAQTLGTLPVGSQTLTQTVAGDNAGKGVTGDVIQQFESLVNDAIKAGMPRPQALQAAIADSPDVYGQYRQALTKMTPEQRESRRLRNLQISGDFKSAS
jgi:deferrochelatase/peroxidase EfeB